MEQNICKTHKLNATLASNSPADPEDTLKTKKNLNKLGYMEIPSYGLDDMPDKPLFDGIKNFQQDNDLKIDGVMKPGGETEATLNNQIKKSEEKPKEVSINPARKDLKDQPHQPPSKSKKASALEKPITQKMLRSSATF